MTLPNNSDSIVAVAQGLKTAVDGMATDLGIQYTAYGDQSKIPAVPAVCVEPNSKTREPQGTYQMTQNTFTVFLLVYLAKIGKSDETVRLDTDTLAESIETRLHQDLQLGGLLVHGYVQEIESGYTYRAGTLYRSARMTYMGLSKTLLRSP